jgi:Haem-binding uptake, Tiki superfamily, ChaN
VKLRRLLLVTALLSGCATSGKPPLPKFALGEAPPTPPPDARAAKLRGTDVIYFGLTKSSAADNPSTWRIVETLQDGGTRVALGWTDLPATQQPLLDQWRRGEISTPLLLDHLGAPARNDWLRPALRPGLIQLALGAPPALLRKIHAGEALSAEERALLPNDYRPPQDAFDNFADRVTASAHLRRYDLVRLYRLHLAAEQMIAENIVRFMRDRPGVKLLVLLPDDVMINSRDVADFVAQKAALQQLILDRSGWQIVPQKPSATTAALPRHGCVLAAYARPSSRPQKM